MSRRMRLSFMRKMKTLWLEDRRNIPRNWVNWNKMAAMHWQALAAVNYSFNGSMLPGELCNLLTETRMTLRDRKCVGPSLAMSSGYVDDGSG